MNMMNLNKKSTAIQRFFWFCAGADIEVLERCPSAWHKYTALGVFVCIVALMAVISGTFFLTESFQMPVYTALPGGIVWGCVIFCVDRVMLVFYKKGEGEWKRIAPRLVLSLLLSIVINEPLFVRTMKGEIEARIFNETQNAEKNTRNNSHLQTRKNQLETEINQLKEREKLLRDATDANEQEMDKERGGVKTDTTTGKDGEGVVYEMKKKIYDSAKLKYDTEKVSIDEQLTSKTQQLQQVEADIAKEVEAKGKSENGNNGFWRRHELMFEMMWEKPYMIIVFLIASLVLLGIETMPITQKFLAEEDDYDRFLEEKNKLAKEKAKIWAEQERIKMLNQHKNYKVVSNRVGGFISKREPLSDPKEQKLAELIHLSIIRQQMSEIDKSDTISLGQLINIEIVDFPELSIQVAIPVELESDATLENLDKQLAEIKAEVSKEANCEMVLVEATNSKGEFIDTNFLPLVGQLNPDDRKLILRFEPQTVDISEET